MAMMAETSEKKLHYLFELKRSLNTNSSFAYVID